MKKKTIAIEDFKYTIIEVTSASGKSPEYFIYNEEKGYAFPITQYQVVTSKSYGKTSHHPVVKATLLCVSYANALYSLYSFEKAIPRKAENGYLSDIKFFIKAKGKMLMDNCVEIGGKRFALQCKPEIVEIKDN